MREYKFRGKRIDNGEWVYGYYVKSNGHLIHEGDYGNIYTVDPNTVGQYTLLKDKNGVEIYEGKETKLIYGYNETKGYVVWFQNAWCVKPFVKRDEYDYPQDLWDFVNHKKGNLVEIIHEVNNEN